MFGALTDSLQTAFTRLRGKHKLTEDNISDAVRQVRLALLEADVNYSVAKTFIKRVKEKAVGDQVLKSVQPGEQFVKVIHDELVALMGTDEGVLGLGGSPAVVMMCGLQGSGKTTHCAKLAKWLKKKGRCKAPLMVACDLQRPAAIKQLQTLGQQIQVEVFTLEGEQDPVKVAQASLLYAREQGCDLVLLDTAGRLAIDEALMAELKSIQAVAQPDDVLFVANGATGQDAVNTAAAFAEQVEITGSILTMLDSNVRGGAAISIREVTGKPLLFEGIGEKVDDLQLFNPNSMADRILGMGDTINLVRRAQEHIDEDQAADIERKMRDASFTYDDYLQQMQMVKKMGSFKSLLKMLPGIGDKLEKLPLDEKEFVRVEAMILSMTPAERLCRCELSPSRRRRLAAGSGTGIEDVNKLIKSFRQAKKFCKNLPNMNKLQKKMMGGAAWR